MTYKQLVKQIAEQIAKDQFKANRQCYKEEADFLAGEGVTESSYMKDDESLEFFVNEQLTEDVFPAARRAYLKMVKEAYKK